MKRHKLALQAALIVAGSLLAIPSAFAQFSERNIKMTNGIAEDHPVHDGVNRMQEVLTAKSGGKMKITSFWGRRCRRRFAGDAGLACRHAGDGGHVHFPAGGYCQGIGCV